MSKLTKESVTIVIPVRNEEGNVIKNLQSIKDKVDIPYNVIVVDGCSTDQTFSLVSNYSKKNKNVKIIRTTPEKSSFKDSIKVGIDATKTDIVAVMMGDLCDDPETIKKMYEKIQEGWDIVVGSRYMPGGSRIGEPKIQGALSRIVSKTLHLLTGIPICDVSNPFRMYRKGVLNKIKIIHQGNEVSIEEVFRVYNNGSKITEVPTTWKGRRAGKSKFKLLKTLPGYAKLYTWVLLNSWRMQLTSL